MLRDQLKYSPSFKWSVYAQRRHSLHSLALFLLVVSVHALAPHNVLALTIRKSTYIMWCKSVHTEYS